MAAPVNYTCPDIDAVINSIKQAIKIAHGGKADAECGFAKDCFDEIDDELHGLEKQLENLRRSNEELRYWGNVNEQKVSDLEYQVSELQEALDNANNQMDSYRHDIETLKSQL